MLDTITERLKRAARTCAPALIRHKISWMALYLDGKSPEMEEVMDYLLCHASPMGLIFFCYYLAKKVDHNPGIQECKIPILKERAMVQELLNASHGKFGQRKAAHLLRFLEDWDMEGRDGRRLAEILSCLLLENEETQQRDLARELLEIRDRPVFRRAFFREYPFRVEIGYKENRGSEGEYKLFLRLENWVYEFFDLEEYRHVRPDGKAPWGYRIRMPIRCNITKPWTMDQLKEEMRLASEQYLGKMETSVPELQKLFNEFREEYLIPRLYVRESVWFWEYFEKGELG